MQAFVSVRVSPADFEDTIFHVAQLGEVTTKEIRQPCVASDLPKSNEAMVTVTLTLNQVEGSRNWWLCAGALALLLAVVYWIRRAKNRS